MFLCICRVFGLTFPKSVQCPIRSLVLGYWLQHPLAWTLPIGWKHFSLLLLELTNVTALITIWTQNLAISQGFLPNKNLTSAGADVFKKVEESLCNTETPV